MIRVSPNREKLYGVRHGWPAMLGKYIEFTYMQLFLSEKGADDEIARIKEAEKQRSTPGAFVQKITFVKNRVEDVTL